MNFEATQSLRSESRQTTMRRRVPGRAGKAGRRMASDFDPLDQWLAIPPDEQPPDHYRLLGLPLFESDRHVIAEAAQKRKALVQSHRSGPHAQLARKLESQLAKATACLLNPYRKQLYDQHLRSSLAKRDQREALWPPDPESAARSESQSSSPRAASSLANQRIAVSDRIRRPSRQQAFNPSWRLIGAMTGTTVLLAIAIIAIVAWPSGDSPEAADARETARPEREVQTDPNEPNPSASFDSPGPTGKAANAEREIADDVTLGESNGESSGTAPSVTLDLPAMAEESPRESSAVSPERFPLPAGANTLRFDGHGFVEIPKDDEEWFDFTKPFTIELWARFSPEQQDHWLIGNLVYGSNHPSLDSSVVAGWQLWVMEGQTGRRRVAVATGNGFWGEFPIRTNSWRHIAFCRDAEQFYLYVDGRRVAAQPVTQLLSTYRPSPLPLHVGGHALLHSTQPAGFRGDLRGLRISSGCRYATNFAPAPLQPDEATTLCWSFAGEEASTIGDLAAGNHTGHLNRVQWSVDRTPLKIAPPGVPVGSKPASPQTAPTKKPTDDLAPIPNENALIAARQTLHDVLGDDLASSRDRSEQARLVDKLRTLASGSDIDAPSRYVLFEEACRQAAIGQSWTQLDELLRQWRQFFPVDAHQVEAGALSYASGQLRELADRRALARRSLELLPKLIRQQQWETASAMVELVTDVATAARDAELGKAARYWRNQATRMRRRADDAEKARARLADQPNDEKAHLTLGRHLCFDRRKWTDGLPHLAAGSDPSLAAAAQAELAGATTARAQIELVGRWVNAAKSEEGLDRAAVLEHALSWARRAIPDLTGLEKVEATRTAEAIEADLEQLAATSGQASSGSSVPAAAVTEPPPGFHGMLGRIQVDGRDAGILWKYGSGLSLSQSNLTNILQQAGINASAIRVEFSGLFNLSERATVQVVHRGGTPQRGTASLAIDGRTVSDLGGDKPSEAVFAMELEPGLHRVTWTLAGTQLGSCSIQLINRDSKQPLAVFHTPAMLSTLRETPFRARINVNMVQN